MASPSKPPPYVGGYIDAIRRLMWAARVYPGMNFSSSMFSASFLFASLVWGSVGLGYFIYGKKQSSWAPMIAGLIMMALSYFVSSALLMSLACLALMAAVYILLKQGY